MSTTLALQQQQPTLSRSEISARRDSARRIHKLLSEKNAITPFKVVQGRVESFCSVLALPLPSSIILTRLPRPLFLFRPRPLLKGLGSLLCASA